MQGVPSFAATAGELVALLTAGGMPAKLYGPDDVRVTGVAPLDDAGPQHLAFVRSENFLRKWSEGRSGITLVSASLVEGESGAPLREPGARAVVAVPDADLALVALLRYAEGMLPDGHPAVGVHPQACVDPSAKLGERVRIGPFVQVGAGAEIGDDTVLRAGAVVGERSRVGRSTVLYEHVVVGERCAIGSETRIHAQTSIGADGFGYRPPVPGGALGPFPIKIPHIGTVVIGDHVEIGANSNVDRSTFNATVVGDGTKIDNLVQIGHNCVIGAGCIICGCCGLAGSVTLGNGVTLGGRVAIADGRTIGDGATIGAGSGVAHDVPAGETWLGAPARPGKHFLRTVSTIDQLVELLGPIKGLLRKEGRV